MKQTDEYELIFSGDDKGLAAATDNVRKKMEGMAEGGNKVKKHLTGFIQDATNATSATQVLASGVYRLSESFKIGIAGGVIAGVMMQIKDSADETTKQMDVLADSFTELNKSQNTSDYAKPIERLKAEAESAKKQASELAKTLGGIEDAGLTDKQFWQAAGQSVKDIIGGGNAGDTFRGLRETLRNQITNAENIEGKSNREIIRREEMQGKDMDLRISEATGPASLQKSLGIRAERLKIAKEELHLAQNAAVIDKADIQQKTLALRQSEQSLKALNAEEGLADSLYKIEQRKMAVRLSNEGTAEKSYRLAKLTAEATAEEAKAMESKNTEQAKFLGLKAQEAAKVPGQIDESLNKGKSSKEIRERIRDQQKEERETAQFRARREKDEGLIPTKRDMQGRVEEGIDPVTGEKVVKGRRWDKIFDKRKEDAKKDGEGVAAAAEKKKKAEAEKGAGKDQNAQNTEKLKSEVEKTNKHLEGLRKEIGGLVSKR